MMRVSPGGARDPGAVCHAQAEPIRPRRPIRGWEPEGAQKNAARNGRHFCKSGNNQRLLNFKGLVLPLPNIR